jgi:hypothetical protein
VVSRDAKPSKATPAGPRSIAFDGTVTGVQAEGGAGRLRIGEITQPLIVDGDAYARRAAGLPQAHLEMQLHAGEARLFLPWFGRRVRVVVELVEPGKEG